MYHHAEQFYPSVYLCVIMRNSFTRPYIHLSSRNSFTRPYCYLTYQYSTLQPDALGGNCCRHETVASRLKSFGPQCLDSRPYMIFYLWNSKTRLDYRRGTDVGEVVGKVVSVQGPCAKLGGRKFYLSSPEHPSSPANSTRVHLGVTHWRIRDLFSNARASTEG
jgi:hypothetical protein